MDEEIATFIVNELGKHHSREDITLAVCEKSGLSWPQAEQLIKQVEEQHKGAITRRQSPFLLAISFVTIIAGLILLGYGVLFFMEFFQQDTLGRALLLRIGYLKLISMAIGLGMLGGGMYGLYKTLINLFAES